MPLRLPPPYRPPASPGSAFPAPGSWLRRTLPSGKLSAGGGAGPRTQRSAARRSTPYRALPGAEPGGRPGKRGSALPLLGAGRSPSRGRCGALAAPRRCGAGLRGDGGHGLPLAELLGAVLSPESSPALYLSPGLGSSQGGRGGLRGFFGSVREEQPQSRRSGPRGREREAGAGGEQPRPPLSVLGAEPLGKSVSSCTPLFEMQIQMII